jgi:hypothetical protein
MWTDDRFRTQSLLSDILFDDMYRLTESQTDELLQRPEFGMGYQFVQATLSDNETKPGVAYNADLLVIGSEPRLLQLSSADYERHLRTAKSAFGQIKAVRFDPRQRPLTLSGGTRALGVVEKAAPAKDGPEDKTKAGEVFRRFSAYQNDNRIKPDGGWRDGTYATTDEDAQNAKTGKDAVARYALPNASPASYRFMCGPSKDTVIQKGTVEAAFDQPGGGVEVLFKSGTQPKTVTTPPDTIPDE